MGLSQLVHKVQPKNITTTRPGNVGSVGEVVVRTRFRQSAATMPWAYDPYFDNTRSKKMGSNVQNGYSTSIVSGGGPATTNDKGWNGNRSFKHQYGYSQHDIRPTDNLTIPIDSELPKFGWRRMVARTRNVRGGSYFMPMGYKAAGKPRGGLYPTATGHGGITPASQAYDPENDAPVVIDPNGPNPDNDLRAGPNRIGQQGPPPPTRGPLTKNQVERARRNMVDLRIF